MTVEKKLNQLLATMAIDEGENRIVPFGKYKGEPLAVLRRDRDYVDWLAAQDGIRKQYPWIFNVTINNGSAAANTPEHNRYQAMFLDQEFAGDVFDFCHGGARIRDVLRERAGCFEPLVRDQMKIIEDMRKPWMLVSLELSPEEAEARAVEAQRVIDEEIQPKHNAELSREVTREELSKVTVEFEVPMRVQDGYNRTRMTGPADVQLKWYGYVVRIEIKPDMGDDYPAVLREMRASHCNVLYLVNYNGAGATLDQVKRMFEASDILIVEHSEFWE